MLTPILAHPGQPPAPHDLWGAWNLDPVLLGGFLLAAWAFWRGQTSGPRRPVDSWRARCFTVALVALGLALLSPLDALSNALASAHMVQHLLLLLVAAPLLALSAPSSAILRGSPLALRRASGRWRRRLGLTHGNLGVLRHPAAVWLLAVGVVWVWHAAAPYDATLDNELLHVLEHASFLATAVLFWHVVVGVRGAARVSGGLGVLLVFTMAMQSVFLSVLLTFARTPWCSSYAATTAPWGLDPLTDQRLAGVIMWIPAGGIYLLVALALLVTWIRATEREDVAL
ncbi:MAG TPA: cytochrome c oxidase assembly protein [Propionibacteriaceae bacterium]|nr:cytochrome c oxidase assembly protein [Propionibacteriaceae bacterium]